MPLVIARTRGGTGRRVAPPVELVDLYPTVRALVAPDREAVGLEGDSLVPLLGPDAAAHDRALSGFRLAFSQAGGGAPGLQYRSVQDERWKLILHPEHQGSRPRPERWQLYRLERDPAESRDLSKRETAELERLRPELEAWMKGGERLVLPPDETEAQSEEALKALKALGYLD